MDHRPRFSPSSLVSKLLVGAASALVTSLSFGQSLTELQVRDSGRVRSFAVAVDEVEIKSNTPTVDLKSAVEGKVAGASVVRTSGGSAVVKLAAPTSAEAGGAKAQAVSAAIPGAELAPVFYEKGVDATQFTRRVGTRNVLAKLKAGQTPEQLAKVAGAAEGKASSASGYAVLNFGNAYDAIAGAQTLRDSGSEADVLLARQLQPRSIPNDPYFPNQWHLRNTGQGGGTAGVDANVTRVWDFTRGAGVNIAIIDDGLEITHEDLAPNAYPLLSKFHHNYNGGPTDDPTPGSFDNHGTAVGGVAAAKGNNNIGVSGSAPDASLVGLRLIAGPISDLDIADALYWHPVGLTIDTSNNSWGPSDGSGFRGAGFLTKQALADAAQLGRGGKGLVTVFAAGNGLQYNDNSNYDGLANSRFVLAVAATTNFDDQAWYSEPGANILVAAPSNGGSLGIFTTDKTSAGYNPGAGEPADLNYTNSFGGTSSASPLTTGGVALLLAANPNLGWRDVHEILTSTARQNQPTDTDWVFNGGGFKFNHKWGGGVIDLTAALARAKDWTNLGTEVAETVALANPLVPAAIPENTIGVSRLFNFATQPNLRIERVEVVVDITHAHRSDLEITLTSPSGTKSVLSEFRPRPNPLTGDDDTDITDNGAGWAFTTTHHWGENSQGGWTLLVRDLRNGTTGTLNAATINIYGTSTTNTQRFTFAKQKDTVDETGEPSNPGFKTVRVNRIGGSTGTATIDYVISPVGTATESLDFTGVSGTLTFVDGQTADDIVVPILDDFEAESTESFYVLLKNPTGAELGGITVSEVDILDDELNRVTVTTGDRIARELNLGEIPDTGTFIISRAKADPTPLDVTFTITGTATLNTDYVIKDANGTVLNSPTSVRIPPLENSVLLRVEPKPDTEVEGTETVVLTLDPGPLVDVPNSAQVSILDNDLPGVQISASPGSLLENSTAPITFTVTRSTTAQSIGLPLLVNLSVGGSARPTIDYLPPIPDRITIPAGAKSVQFTTNTVNDSLYTGTRMIAVAIAPSPEYIDGFLTRAEVAILEDDALTDAKPPLITVKTPVNKARINVPGAVSLTGTATDNGTIATVRYRVNAGPWKLAKGTTSWSADIASDSIPGPNRVEVQAFDNANNGSKVVALAYAYVNPHTLTVNVGSGGAVSSGFTPSSTREAGQPVSITALPAAGFSFAGWVATPAGGAPFTSTARTFTFNMPDANVTLAASFVSNPFSPAIAGSYEGLVTDATAFAGQSAGLLQVKLMTTGSFTGTLVLDGVKYPLKGEFTSQQPAVQSARWVALIPRKNTIIPLSVDLTLNLPSRTITGTIAPLDSSFSAIALAERAAFDRATAPYQPAAGKPQLFTIALPPQAASIFQPRGNGYATLSIDSGGIVKWSGVLADGTKVSQSTALVRQTRGSSSQLAFPLFANAYGNRGVILGYVDIDTNQIASDLSGLLDWFKPQVATDKLFPLGFTITDTPITGDLFTPPAKGARVLSDFDVAPGNAGKISFRKGNLDFSNPSREFDAKIVIDAANKAVVTDLSDTFLENVKVSIVANTGLFSGSFVHPITQKLVTFGGAFLQRKHHAGFGGFTGSLFSGGGLQTGSISIVADPAGM